MREETRERVARAFLHAYTKPPCTVCGGVLPSDRYFHCRGECVEVWETQYQLTRMK